MPAKTGPSKPKKPSSLNPKGGATSGDLEVGGSSKLPKSAREGERNGSRFYGPKPGPAFQPAIVPSGTPRSTFAPPVVTGTGGVVGTGIPQAGASDGGQFSTLSGGDGTGGVGMPGGYSSLNYGVLWDDPNALAQDFLARNYGIDNPQMTEMLGPIADAMAAVDFIMNMGQPGQFQNVDETARFVEDALATLTTPGGPALQVEDIFSAMASADPNSPLGAYMAQASTNDVNNLVNSVVRAAGGNPYMGMGVAAMMNQQGRNYNIDYAKGGQGIASDPYYAGLRSGPLGRYFGGGVQ